MLCMTISHYLEVDFARKIMALNMCGVKIINAKIYCYNYYLCLAPLATAFQ